METASDLVPHRRERKARALLEQVRDRLVAGEEVGGSMELAEVRPRHVAAMVRGWIAEAYAPRTVRNVYYTMKSMFWDAAVEGLIDASPCILGRAQLPKIVDAHREWRATAQYTRDELVALITDPRLPEHERVANAILGLAGLRVGEMGGLHVRNLSLDMLPLGRIVVARSYNKRGTKTKVVRWMPVHPALATILRRWIEHGFAETMGRAPEPDDLVLPAGADKDILRRGTHRFRRT